MTTTPEGFQKCVCGHIRALHHKDAGHCFVDAIKPKWDYWKNKAITPTECDCEEFKTGDE